MQLKGTTHTPNLIGGGIALFLLFTSARAWDEGAIGNAFGLALVAAAVLLTAVWLNRRRYSAMDDTPTSRVASAAQGYVELLGRGRQMPGQIVLSPLTQLPCLWYRYRIFEEKRFGSGDRRTEVEHGVSDDRFLLCDDSGQCVIDPEGAEVHTTRFSSWKRGRLYYEEWLLLAEDRLYAIGQFSSVRPADAPRSVRQDVSATLAEWKQNRSELLRRFDTDGDGQISTDEWEKARAAALEQVSRDHRDLDRQEGYHFLSRARGRPYIISNRNPDDLSRALRGWARVHLAGLAGCILWLCWIVTHLHGSTTAAL